MRPTTKTLTLATLADLSTDLAEDFATRLKLATEDCEARPGLPKDRELIISLKLRPHPDDADDANITPQIRLKLPARELDPVRARRTKRAGLLFDLDPPEDD